MSAAMLLVILAAVVIPLGLYVREGWAEDEADSDGTGATPHDRTEFFVGGRRLDPTRYAVTTVAYGLQMAAVVLFAQWGYYYGYWALIVPAAWCAGFLLLAGFVGRLDDFLKSPQTLHEYLGSTHGDSRTLVLLAAFATILGLGGALFAELGYVGDLVQHLTERTDSFKYWLMFFFLASVLIYVLPRGFSAVVNTDRRQLPTAYIGLAALLGAVLYVGGAGGGGLGGAAALGIGAFLAIAVVAAFGVLQADRGRRTGGLLVVATPVVALVLTLAGFALGATADAGGASWVSTREAWAPVKMPTLTIVSLVLANGLWQLVDLSAFQRLTALDLPAEGAERRKRLRVAILWTALESPLSWCIGVAIGVGLGQLGVFGGPDGAWAAYEGFMVAMAKGEGVGEFLPVAIRCGIVGLSLAGIIGIMLSTVDSLGVTVAFTATSDVLGEKEGASKSWGRAATVVVIGLVWLLFWLWQSRIAADHDISAWLYIAYAMQLSLLGVCTAALLGVRLPRLVAIASVAGGVVGSIWLGGRLALAGDFDVFVLPPIVAVGVSLAVALPWLLVALLRRRPQERGGEQ